MLLNATMIMEDKTQLGRDSNNGPIRMITTNTSDAEKRLVTCKNKKTGQINTTAVEKM